MDRHKNYDSDDNYIWQTVIHLYHLFQHWHGIQHSKIFLNQVNFLIEEVSGFMLSL